ncbi:helix-turn-helix domain-containing protein [Dokdonella sp.]|uniref:helix-turn-helix domain-containing protein n=1 Tax=Dokdonella sp. TaxID=2291710 RepID=UPI003AF431D7
MGTQRPSQWHPPRVRTGPASQTLALPRLAGPTQARAPHVEPGSKSSARGPNARDLPAVAAREIARELQRSASTVSHELARNAGKEGDYRARQAQRQAW